MRFLLVVAAWMSSVLATIFPCGPSFTPCETKAFGVKTNTINGSFSDKSVSPVIDIQKRYQLKNEVLKSLSKESIIQAAKNAKAGIEKLFNQTENQILRSTSENSFSPTELSWFHYTQADQYAKYLSYSALISTATTQKLISPSSSLHLLESLSYIPLEGSAIESNCPVNLIKECVAQKYRTYSGHCNNVNQPLQGAVYEPLKRLINPDYFDRVSAPRRAASSAFLPSAGKVASLFTSTPSSHSVCSLMLAQWASFVYDDLAHIASNRLIKNAFFSGSQQIPLPCCDKALDHPECFSIDISEGDVSDCIGYSRSIPVPRENCTLGPREQGNMVSGYIDGSQIYGSTTDIANKMRSFEDGKLLFRHVSSKYIRYGLPLPANEIESDCRSKSPTSQPCFLAGSNRINFLPTSAVLYVIWMRQHNGIAEKLKEVNPHWNDERLFQESRRVVIAQIQHITYSEFLPIIIGKENLKRNGLDLRAHGYDSGYELKVDGSTLNVFASAVGQFFLTLLPNHIAAMNSDGSVYKEELLSKVYNDPSMVYHRSRFDSLLRFLIQSPIMKPGLHFAPELRNIFKRVDSLRPSRRIDLAAIIIQMGRDHGIPGYLDWRRFCGLENLQSFSAISGQFKSSVNISDFVKIYEAPEDIDLFVGGLAEVPVKGALLGPTFACLFAKQMERSKRGDRFWYENFFFPSAFSEAQVAEIRKTTLARVLCNNAENLNRVQHNVFSLPDEYGNCPVSCNSTTIESFDPSPWTDEEPDRDLPITKATVEKAIRLGVEQYTRLVESEGRRIEAKGPSSRVSAIYSHASLMAPKNESLHIATMAGVLREATQVLIKGTGLDDSERLPSDLDVSTLHKLLPEINVELIIGNFTPFLGLDLVSKEQCLPQPLPCDHTSKYRTYSGWCNNIQFPKYGNAFGPMRRLLDPAYDDGFDSPRTRTRSGAELPSARTVSNVVHKDAPIFHVKFSHMLMQFGQIIDHDMMHSPIARGPNNTILNCSSCDSYEILSVHCFPIKIDEDDPYFPHRDENGQPRCMPFARSLLGQLTLGYRNQLNQLTSFLDASFLYGSTECEANRLRLFSFGRLNYTDLGFNKEALPQGNQERDCRSVLNSSKKKCFVAGDERNNEQPGLTVMHTILLREHNRIATKLHRMNNFWTDEQLYQEARRINIAQIQNIIFKEWLPVVLGCEVMAQYDLMPKKTGYYKGYNSHCDPSITQEMSTAAFRFGHTLIREHFPRMNDVYKNMSEPVKLKDHFSNPSPLYEQNVGHLESMLMGLLGAESMAFDRHITDAVRNHLFAKPDSPLTGIDLPAVNIQRGRDHGVRPYNDYRELCGLRRVASFEGLRGTMDEDAVQALKRVYKHVDDIDLFPGIMSERPVKGALVGPSLACIIAEQMERLKKCDRFYYETDDPNVRFSPDQLAEIRKTSLAMIICYNSQFARKIQPNVFLIPDDLNNAPLSCSEIPDIDLFKWVDRQFCVIDHRIIILGKTKRITPCVTCTCTAEGPECHAITIHRCSLLLKDFPLADVAKDPVCVIQCSQFIKESNNKKNNDAFP